jgi:chromatin remodeling complex protein RSC6
MRAFTSLRCFQRRSNPVILSVNSASFAGNPEDNRAKEDQVADTTKIKDKLERKKLKRAARKKAAPKAKRTGARGEKKRKVKKMARGVSKR